MATKFVIRDSSAKMPTKVKAPYRRLAIMEMQEDAPAPKMISARAKGCVAIHRIWDRMHARGKNTAFARAMTEAREMVKVLNAHRRAETR